MSAGSALVNKEVFTIELAKQVASCTIPCEAVLQPVECCHGKNDLGMYCNPTYNYHSTPDQHLLYRGPKRIAELTCSEAK